MAGERMTHDLNWLDDFVRRVEHVRQAVILSADGLNMSASGGRIRNDEMAMMVKRVGQHLAARLRPAEHDLAAGIAGP